MSIACLPPEMFTRQQQHHQYKTRDTEHGQHFVSAPFSPSLASAWPLSRSSIDAMMIPFETSVEQLQCPFQCTRSFMASVVPCVVHLFIIIIIVVLFVVSFPVQTYKYFIHNFATFCVSARLFLSLPNGTVCSTGKALPIVVWHYQWKKKEHPCCWFVQVFKLAHSCLFCSVFV